MWVKEFHPGDEVLVYDPREETFHLKVGEVIWVDPFQTWPYTVAFGAAREQFQATQLHLLSKVSSYGNDNPVKIAWCTKLGGKQ